MTFLSLLFVVLIACSAIGYIIFSQKDEKGLVNYVSKDNNSTLSQKFGVIIIALIVMPIFAFLPIIFTVFVLCGILNSLFGFSITDEEQKQIVFICLSATTLLSIIYAISQKEDKVKIDKVKIEIASKEEDRIEQNKKLQKTHTQGQLFKNGIVDDYILQKIREQNKNSINSIKRKLKTLYPTLQKLQSIDPYQFEFEVSKMYKRLGYTARMTRKSNDGGKDIILYKDNCKYLVECKRFNTNNKVGREYLQKFYAAICEENADLGFFVTTSDFTKDEYDYVANWCKKIQLINGKKLVEIINTSNLAVINKISLNLYCEKCTKPINFKNLSSLSEFCENDHIIQNPIYSLIKEYERAI